MIATKASFVLVAPRMQHWMRKFRQPALKNVRPAFTVQQGPFGRFRARQGPSRQRWGLWNRLDALGAPPASSASAKALPSQPTTATLVTSALAVQQPPTQVMVSLAIFARPAASVLKVFLNRQRVALEPGQSTLPGQVLQYANHVQSESPALMDSKLDHVQQDRTAWRVWCQPRAQLEPMAM